MRRPEQSPSIVPLSNDQVAAKLLARKQQLLERLQEGPGPHEREEIERLMAEIDSALDSVEEAGLGNEQMS
jgi:hypothetical protein